jgi:hypothetical protein
MLSGAVPHQVIIQVAVHVTHQFGHMTISATQVQVELYMLAAQALGFDIIALLVG